MDWYCDVCQQRHSDWDGRPPGMYTKCKRCGTWRQIVDNRTTAGSVDGEWLLRHRWLIAAMYGE